MRISNDELDALREVINIGVGRAAGALNDMIGRTVQLTVPSVSLVTPQEIVSRQSASRLAYVQLDFQGALRGAVDLIFPSESASKLVALLTGEDLDAPDLDSLRAGTLTEVGNILLNGLMGSITNIIGEHVDYGLPVYGEDSVNAIQPVMLATPNAAILLAQAHFFIGESFFEIAGERIDGEFTLLLGVDSLEYLVDRLQHLGEEALT
jgi:chemotaxis protein CheC